MSPIQWIFGGLIVGIATIGAFQVLGPLISGGENENMVQEVTALTSSINRMCKMAGCASVTEFQDLTDNGYLDSDFYTDGIGENAINNDITAVTASATTVTFTYDTGDSESCNFILDHDGQFVGVDAVGTCNAAGLLTLTVR